MAITRHLRQLREQRGWTLDDVAHLMGRSTSYVSKMEIGQRHLRAEALEDFARLYGVPPCRLVTFTELPPALRCVCQGAGAENDRD